MELKLLVFVLPPLLLRQNKIEVILPVHSLRIQVPEIIYLDQPGISDE